MKTRLLTLIVVLLGLSHMACAQRYLTFGRDPQIPGGLTAEKAEAMGWQPFQLKADRFLTMYGAKGESVSGWVRAGTWVAWDSSGNLRILQCGNRTNIVREYVKVPGPTRIEYRTKEVPGPERIIHIPGPERVRTEYEYRDRLVPILMLAPQQQFIGNLGAPTVIAPTVGGGVSILAGRGGDINVSNKVNVVAKGGNSSSSSSSSSSASAAASAAAAAAAAGGK